MRSSTPSKLETPSDLPTFADVEAAAARIDGAAVKTPLLDSPALSQRLDARVLIKPETLQRTGSFKFRGAYNKLSQISEPDRRRGVVAYSSGNHAQGVAAAAALLDIAATIVMPADAPAIKIDNTRGYGATVELYDRGAESRTQVAAKIVERTGAILVRPFDDPEVIAGQGTCGLEMVRQADALGFRLDLALICCGGGGLTAGCALAFNTLSPATKLYTVEPAGFDDTARSLAAQQRVGIETGHVSFCDALLAPKPGALTFAINRAYVSGGLAVSDAEVAAAMAYGFRTLKLVIEPGGAVTLAALLAGKIDVRGKTVAITLSGGNVDRATFETALRMAEDA